MVDFNKKFHYTDKFRQAALTFQKTGKYCAYPNNTQEYFAYWDQETDRCLNGYTAEDGDWISGYNYFYLNYCPMSRIVYKEVNGKQKKINDFTFPDFWDYDTYYFYAVDDAQQVGKHLVLLKSRRRGYSYKGAAMACRDYYLIPNSKTFIYAANKQYLTEDGILTKAWDYMDFIDKNTAWGKKRSVSTATRRRAGFFSKDEYGNVIELGYKSEITGLTLKDNPSVIRGKRATLIMFEEGGSMKELSAAWQIARPSVEIDGQAFASMIVWGTGGDNDENVKTLKDMFYRPEGYNCLEFDNIWDNTVNTKKCGFFVPQWSNVDARDENGNRICMDEDGNTLTEKAKAYILEERRKVLESATNQEAIDRYVCERPCTPAEAMLSFKGNIFPKKELQTQLARIRTDKVLSNAKQVGDLVFDANNQLQWIQKKTGDITHYPLGKDEDKTGSIVIWEHPSRDAAPGLYIAGLDSYDYDSSTTDSLGSCFIYKRFQNFEEYSDIIVAEYTGRPQSANDFYENVRKLLLYYNATCMYENQNKGIFVYLSNKGYDYLLADSPTILQDTIGLESKVNRKKGCHMNQQIKTWGEGLIKEWLNELDDKGIKNLYKIMSEPLLEELISYNSDDNFDRCILKDNLITTFEGFKPIQDIVVGDRVLTDNGTIQKVTWIDKHRHTGNKVKLKLTGDYRILECTDNHPIKIAFTTKKTHCFRKEAVNNISYLRADQLNYKYQFGLIPKRKLTESIDLSDDVLYLLGWVMSDGYVEPNGYGVRITYQIDQLNCAKKCMNIIEEYLKDEQFYYTKNGRNRLKRKPSKIFRYNNCWRLEIHSWKLHQLCTWFGCLPNHKKINPEIYNRYNNLMPFIIGWLEGDGHQRLNCNYDGNGNRNGIELSTIYEELIHQCRQIMIDHGIYSSIRRVKTKVKYRDQYSILLSNEFVNKVLSYYPSLKFITIPDKKPTCKCLETEDGFWAPIKILSIEPMDDDVYNFEVDNNHTYIAQGIVVHNCMSCIQLLIYRQQLMTTRTKKLDEEEKKRVLFDKPLFTDEWFADNSFDNQIDNDIPIFTFNKT